MAKTTQPTFSSSMRLTPSHSPPASIAKDSEPFFQPTSSGRTGMDFSAIMHQSASQPELDTPMSLERTGKDSSAGKHQLTSQLRSD